MRRRRVKITGIGPVTPAGIGVERYWSGLRQGKSFIRKLNRQDTSETPLVAAYISDFKLKDYISQSVLYNGAARHTEFATAAAVLALRNAGIRSQELADLPCAVIAGASLLDFGGIGKSFKSVFSKGHKAAQPRVVFTSTLTSIAETISAACRLTARTIAVQSSCCAGLDAVGQSAQMIESGEVDLAICGGTEAPLYPFPLFELQAAGLTPSNGESPLTIAKPFDLWRTTGVVSEGACFFVLESEESARKPLAWVSGYGFASDICDEICSGLTASNLQAIYNANLRPEDVQCISAWGPGHRLVDRGEYAASEKVFGDNLARIPAYSIKGAIGSPLGAAPSMQLAAAILGLNSSLVLQTVNWSTPDPECRFCLSRENRIIYHENVLVNAHGVGNVNSSLLISK